MLSCDGGGKDPRDSPMNSRISSISEEPGS